MFRRSIPALSATLALLLLCFAGNTYSQGTLANEEFNTKSDTITNPKLNIKVGGQMRLNAFYDFSALQDLETFNIISIPTDENHNDSPRFSLGVKQSRLSLSIGYLSKKLGPITSYFEGDFLGNGFLNFRMRFFYVDIKNFRIGETWSTFCDEDAWPDVIDFDGPPTGTWARTSQIRYTHQLNTSNTIAFAIETPQTDITPIASLDTTIAETFQGFPDITGRWSNSGKLGHIQLALIYRRLHYLRNEKTLSNNAGGASLSGHLNIRKNDKLILQATAGSGIASYLVSFMGGGYDAVTTDDGVLSNIPIIGGYVAYELWLMNSLKSTWVYGYTEMHANIDELPANRFTGNYLSGNLFWLLDNRMTIGLEGQYGAVSNFFKESGNAARLQAMFLFNF